MFLFYTCRNAVPAMYFQVLKKRGIEELLENIQFWTLKYLPSSWAGMKPGVEMQSWILAQVSLRCQVSSLFSEVFKEILWMKWLIKIRGEQKSLSTFCRHNINSRMKKNNMQKDLQWSHITEQTVFLPILCCWLLLSAQSANCGQFCHGWSRHFVPKLLSTF